jgi:hypothetical protein
LLAISPEEFEGFIFKFRHPNMAAKSRISELAAQIQTSTAVIDDSLKENNLPTPSFDENGPVEFGLKSGEAKPALDIAKTSSLELFDLLQGPALVLRPVVKNPNA